MVEREVYYNFGSVTGTGQNFDSLIGRRDQDSDASVKAFDKEDRETVMVRFTAHGNDQEFHEFKDFKKLKLLGTGSLSKVYLVELQTNKTLYAMKAFRKDFLIDNNLI